ncbi:hypothetical protein JCM10207_000049 [Rhodosporidiobolus poonsookiae]
MPSPPLTSTPSSSTLPAVPLPLPPPHSDDLELDYGGDSLGDEAYGFGLGATGDYGALYADLDVSLGAGVGAEENEGGEEREGEEEGVEVERADEPAGQDASADGHTITNAPAQSTSAERPARETTEEGELRQNDPSPAQPQPQAQHDQQAQQLDLTMTTDDSDTSDVVVFAGSGARASAEGRTGGGGAAALEQAAGEMGEGISGSEAGGEKAMEIDADEASIDEAVLTDSHALDAHEQGADDGEEGDARENEDKAGKWDEAPLPSGSGVPLFAQQDAQDEHSLPLPVYTPVDVQARNQREWNRSQNTLPPQTQGSFMDMIQRNYGDQLSQPQPLYPTRPPAFFGPHPPPPRTSYDPQLPFGAARGPLPYLDRGCLRADSPPPTHAFCIYTLLLPSANLGSFLIGPGGSMQKRLKGETGLADLSVQNLPPLDGPFSSAPPASGPDSPRCVLVGTPFSIRRALAAIERHTCELFRPLDADEYEATIGERAWVAFDEARLERRRKMWIKEQFVEREMPEGYGGWTRYDAGGTGTGTGARPHREDRDRDCRPDELHLPPVDRHMGYDRPPPPPLPPLPPRASQPAAPPPRLERSERSERAPPPPQHPERYGAAWAPDHSGRDDQCGGNKRGRPRSRSPPPPPPPQRSAPRGRGHSPAPRRRSRSPPRGDRYPTGEKRRRSRSRSLCRAASPVRSSARPARQRGRSPVSLAPPLMPMTRSPSPMERMEGEETVASPESWELSIPPSAARFFIGPTSSLAHLQQLSGRRVTCATDAGGGVRLAFGATLEGAEAGGEEMEETVRAVEVLVRKVEKGWTAAGQAPAPDPRTSSSPLITRQRRPSSSTASIWRSPTQSFSASPSISRRQSVSTTATSPGERGGETAGEMRRGREGGRDQGREKGTETGQSRDRERRSDDGYRGGGTGERGSRYDERDGRGGGRYGQPPRDDKHAPHYSRRHPRPRSRSRSRSPPPFYDARGPIPPPPPRRSPSPRRYPSPPPRKHPARDSFAGGPSGFNRDDGARGGGGGSGGRGGFRIGGGPVHLEPGNGVYQDRRGYGAGGGGGRRDGGRYDDGRGGGRGGGRGRW